MFESTFGNELLTWILIAAVFLSLILSVVALILQIQRGRPQKTKQKKKEKSNAQTMSSQQTYSSNPYTPQQPQAWVPPVTPVAQSSHTEPLFSASPQSYATPGNTTEQLQSGGYHIYMKETTPMGERNHEITVNGEFPIGRAPSRGLQIDLSTVSRLQCVLISGPDNVFVSNRSTSNISLLNGIKLEDTRSLKPGDTLSFGNVQLTLLSIGKDGAN